MAIDFMALMVHLSHLPYLSGNPVARFAQLVAVHLTQVQLEAGLYHLRALDDAQLRVLAGGVRVTSTSYKGKDSWPELSPHPDGAAAAAVGAAVAPREQRPPTPE
jgi:hypothetical protein